MKRLYQTLKLALLITGLSALALLAAPAGQEAPGQAPVGQPGVEEDGPGPGVARISLMNGDVSVRRGDSGDSIAAAINGPLMADDRVLTGPGARAEVALNYYNRVRLAGDTEVRFPELDQHKYEIQIASGTLMFSALPGSNDQLEFATPAAALRPLAAGAYRITVLGGGAVEFTVRRGEADIYTPRGTRRLTPGSTMRVQLAEDGTPEFQIVPEIAPDAFDEFNSRRDGELSQVKSYQHMSRDIEGGEELDQAGEWVDQQPYGYVWHPNVAPDWAPYEYGRWTWEDYYGWTWVSYDPWGWAPYHYGRWFWGVGGWYWYPGGFGAGLWWRPALVGFFGWGGFGVGFGFGGFGWVPLAPFEHFHPWYGRGLYGTGGFAGLNHSIVRNVNVTNTYRNARIANGVHGMSAQSFGRASAGRGSTVPASELSHASAMHGALPVTPSRESLRMSDRAVSSSLASRGAQSGNQSFIGSRQTSSASRMSFDQRRQSISQAMRSATPTTTAAGGVGRTGTTTAGAGNTPRSSATSAGSQGGWPRAGSTAGTAANRTSEATGIRSGTGVSSGTSTSATRGGWGSFGAPGNNRSATAAAGSATRTSGGGWDSFGNPGRSSGYTTNANGNVSVFRSGQNSGATEARPSQSWSTGGGGRSVSAYGNQGGGSSVRTYGNQGGGYSAPRLSGGWNTGAGSSPRYAAPSGGRSYGSSAGSSTPHYSAPAARSGGSTYGGGGGHVSSGGGGHASSGGGHSGHR